MSNTNSHFYKETIALAGVVQAATLVEALAKKNSVSEFHFQTSITSIFNMNNTSVEDVFGGQTNYIPGLSLGLEALCRILNQQLTPGEELIRYSLEIIALQGRLQRSTVAPTISGRIEELAPQLEHYSVTEQPVIAALARIYEDTLSNLGKRIQVTGNRPYLENPYNTHKIRALLLAGVRAAMLWRWVGGKRWHIIFQRKKILLNAHELLG